MPPAQVPARQLAQRSSPCRTCITRHHHIPWISRIEGSAAQIPARKTATDCQQHSVSLSKERFSPATAAFHTRLARSGLETFFSCCNRRPRQKGETRPSFPSEEDASSSLLLRFGPAGPAGGLGGGGIPRPHRVAGDRMHDLVRILPEKSPTSIAALQPSCGGVTVFASSRALFLATVHAPGSTKIAASFSTARAAFVRWKIGTGSFAPGSMASGGCTWFCFSWWLHSRLRTLLSAHPAGAPRARGLPFSWASACKVRFVSELFP
jgi:hypothetical protein